MANESAGDIPQDDFKWFGEGFEGFPKRLPEDCVEYAIYVLDAKLTTDAQVRERLRIIETAANTLTKKLLKDYIWQRESFKLQLQREEGTWLLRGRTNFGDSVADEWLIVYLLRELSSQFPDAWIRVYDTDGEFLLIEAANALPKWLNPEVAENRVWINNGELRIIPLERPKPGETSGPAPGPLTVSEARSYIKDKSIELIHSPMVEEEAFYRIRNYPKEISENLHHSLITIPRKLALILHQNPAYISPAIEAFYLRDPISLKPLKEERPGGLKFPPKDLVTISVSFTKVGYAQLKSQEFVEPKVWEDELSKHDGVSKDRTRLEMGMKVSCGFEMLIADPQNQDKQAVREIQLLLEDVESGDEQLPPDDEVKNWPMQDDDDNWMNVSFEDFEKELAGRKGRARSTTGISDGFGDKAAQENLRKMVERFESFLNDEDAGPEGAEVDDMDFDDDDESDVSSTGEDKDASFDEEEFAKMMREMMGMPEDVYKEVMEMNLDELRKDKPDFVPREMPPRPSHGGSGFQVEELGSDDDEEADEDQAKEFHEMMQRMEAELREAGALNLNPTSQQGKIKDKGKGKQKAEAEEEDVEELERETDDEVEVDIDYNLAKNLLEAFKGQGGMSGPAGNIMEAMGIRFPRDEPEK